jgi:hypothetical protein
MKIKTANIPYITFGISLLFFAIWQRRKVVIMSKRYKGVMEVGDNMGWDNPKFEQKLRNVGWYPGAQWCVFFIKAMWADVYPELNTKTYGGKKIIDYISGNSQTTYQNFDMLTKNTGMFSVSGLPKSGDIAVWQYYDSSGNPTTKGHVGTVTLVKGEVFNTIEGNTSELGKTEETVSKKIHSLGEYEKRTGLKLKGFIHYRNV